MLFNPKFTGVVVLIFISQFIFSQTNWQDNFNDSNFTQGPAWGGDTGSFVINAQYHLQLDAAPITSTKYLSTPSTSGIEATWEFLIQLDFNPSSNNFANVFLMHSDAYVTTSSTGYFLRIGGSSEDRISLFRKDGSADVLVMESNSDLLNASSINARIKVQRNAQHQWQLFVDSTGGNNFTPKASGTDSTYIHSSFFLLQCQFTSTRSTKFYFDDFLVNGKSFVDNIPPSITNTSFPSTNQVELTFSEPLDSATAVQIKNFQIDQGQNTVTQATWLAALPKTVVIQSQHAFANHQPVALFVTGVQDRYANAMKDTTFSLNFFRPQYRDVVFNEIMADPEPTVNLPAVEYIEIANTTLRKIDLSGWHLVADEDTFQLADFTLLPGELRLIVSTSNQGELDSLQPIEIPAGSSWLKNSGEPLVLLDDAYTIIDAVEYSQSWHHSMAKESGGWSLEQLDQTLPCSEPKNWNSSQHPNGGTPGKPNQTEPNLLPENTALKAVKWLNDRQVELVFTSALTPASATFIEASATMDSVVFSPNTPNSLALQFQSNITGQESIVIHETENCIGKIKPDTIFISPPEKAVTGDIIINELLFNASEENAEFVELWNISDKTIFLSDLTFVKYQNGQPTESQPLTDESFLLLPKSIVMFTERPDAVCSHYHCEKARASFTLDNLPSLPNDAGELALTDRAMNTFERISYSEDWHHVSISNPQNVSLERIHPNLDAIAERSWHSASSASGYGTPGQMNSQFRATASGEEQIWLEAKTVSPNNDGLNDVLIIYYKLPKGAVINARIFSMNGQEIATISSNELAEPQGQIAWNGTGKNGQIPVTGIYIVLVDWFTPSGQKGATKLNFALQK